MPTFGINGFGRIGRNVFRAMTPEQRKNVVAVNDLCILTVVILDSIAVSTLFIVSINFELLASKS